MNEEVYNIYRMNIEWFIRSLNDRQLYLLDLFIRNWNDNLKEIIIKCIEDRPK